MNSKKKIDRLHNIRIPEAPQKKKYCRFCKYKILYIDYKEVNFLSSFLNMQGKILPRNYTGNCVRHQKLIAQAIKRSRIMSFLPTIVDNYKMS